MKSSFVSARVRVLGRPRARPALHCNAPFEQPLALDASKGAVPPGNPMSAKQMGCHKLIID